MSALTAVYVPDLPSALERALEARRVERELMRNGYNHLHRVLPAHASRAHAHALDGKATLALAHKETNRAQSRLTAYRRVSTKSAREGKGGRYDEAMDR